MARTYVVLTNTAVDDLATLIGTVDDIPVTINYWISALKGMTVSQIKTKIAGDMLAVLPAAPVQVSQLPTGTFSQ